MDAPALSYRNVTKVYPLGGREPLHALRGVSVEIAPGTRVAITGRSGSGKSTFLHLAAGIDRPTEGEVSVGGRDLSRMTDRELSLHRRRNVGLVFQFFHLLSHLSVLENVTVPSLIAGDPPRIFEPRGRELLDRVGLADRWRDPVGRLSGGEMQRVAICRALIRGATLLLADELTGNLDDENGRIVMDLLLRLTAEEKATLVYVTHSRELAGLADAAWRLHSGILETT